MKKIIQPEVIKKYYNHYPLPDFFNSDITPYVSVIQFESEEKYCKKELFRIIYII